MTIQQAINEFMIEQASRGNTERTLGYYRASLKYFTDYFGSDRDILSVSTADLKSYVISLINTGIKKVTVKSYTRAVKVFFRWCYEEEYIETDITKKFKLIKVQPKVIEVLTDEELNTIINRYDDSVIGIRNKCILLMMCDCGLRLSEVTSLKLDNVSFEHRTALVTGKGGKSRLVPLGSATFEYLKRYLEVRRGTAPELFVTFNGDKLTNSAIDSLFARLRKHTGIKRLHPHLLRHTFATNFIYDGGNPIVLQMIMGHSDIETTQIYLHLAETKRIFATQKSSHYDLIKKNTVPKD